MRYGDKMFGLHPTLTYLEPSVVLYFPFQGANPVRSTFDVNLFGWRGESPITATGAIIGHEIPAWRTKGAQFGYALHNYCPNPSVETNLTSWTLGGALDTLTRSHMEAKYGVYSGRLFKAVEGALSYILIGHITGLAPATNYTIQAWVKKTICNVAGTGQMAIIWYDGGGANIPPNSAAVVFQAGTHDWRKYSTTGLSPALTAQADIFIYSSGMVAGQPWEMFVDGVQLTALSLVRDYVDGSLGTGHSWVGVAHNSQSDRTPGTVLSYTPPAVDKQDIFSISCHFKVPSVTFSTSRIAFDFRNAGNLNAPFISISSGAGQIAFQYGAGATLTSPGAVVAETLHHLVLTVNYSRHRAEMYLDGVLVTSSNAIITQPSWGTALFMGCDYLSSGFFEGVITDWVMFDKVLSQSEVSSIKNLGGPIGLYEDTLYWKDNEIWRPTYPISV